MREPHIIVCVKVVPKPEEVTIDPATLTLNRAQARNEINPPDMNALETALSIKDHHGGRVSVLSMGPPFVERYLRVALAMGADAAYLLSDRAFGGADTLATSYTIARGVTKIGDFDLILCGEESSDGATAQVPPGVAEWLGISQITYATSLDLVGEGWQVRGRREIKGGYEVVAVPMPAVVSLKLGINEPRFMDINRLQGEALPVTIWGLRDMDVEEEMLGLKGSPTVVAGVSQAKAASGRQRQFIQGTPQEKARALLERISAYLGLTAPASPRSDGRR